MIYVPACITGTMQMTSLQPTVFQTCWWRLIWMKAHLKPEAPCWDSRLSWDRSKAGPRNLGPVNVYALIILYSFYCWSVVGQELCSRFTSSFNFSIHKHNHRKYKGVRFRMFMVSTVKSSMGIRMYHYGPASRSVLLLSVWKAYHSLVPLIPHGRAIPQYQSNVWTHLLIQWDFWLVLYFYIYLCFLVNKEDVFF